MQLSCYFRIFAARVYTLNVDCCFFYSDSCEDVIVGGMGSPNSISWLFSSLSKKSAGLIPIFNFHIFRIMTSLNPTLRACMWTRSHCKKLLLYVRTTLNSGIWSHRVFVVAKSLESNISFQVLHTSGSFSATKKELVAKASTIIKLHKWRAK